VAKQDFAQVKANSKTQAEAGSGSVLNAIGIIVIAGLCFSAGYWLGNGDIKQTGKKTDSDATAAKLAAQVVQNRLLQAKNEALQDMVAQWKAKAKQGAHTKVGELTFYKTLPKQPVTPAPVVDLPAATKQARATPSSAEAHPAPQQPPVIQPKPASVGLASARLQHVYRIQLASLRNESDAKAMQRKLTQAGIVSQVRMVDLGSKGHWFRVYAGPYASRANAEAAQQQIEPTMKLKGFIIRDK